MFSDFSVKITVRSGGIFSAGLQMLWLRQGRRKKLRSAAERNTDKARADAARTFSESAEPSQNRRRRKRKMSKKNNRINVPEAREAMDKFKIDRKSVV